ncbi:DUF2189 domain-containing protein [Sulfitobacter sp. TSTF-M16]|uniref:DUF2189 domain-containing protein n=2 Tax=Sulfitobacter aestuariivivens TaxID=2766981 RepID=A0A927D280_9RHOB|nr:DUF2189 domain-containing protein [Sulfitobacter aestuariivivens]MBD3663051.1 DUF2189 domain-containing protein [Sulfitobacter aestuariivivens]
MTTLARVHGAPAFKAPTAALMRHALSAGWRDFLAAPTFGLMMGAVCVAAGWALAGLTMWSGHTFWLVLAVFGFPLVAPFAAIGTYEVSRRRAHGAAGDLRSIVHVLWAERARQLPWLSALMVFVLLFWFFLGHMIFALFLGLKPMTNIMTSTDVFLSADGLLMMLIGSVVGGGFALLIYAVCVVGVPMLLEREVDYVTALLRSIGLVAAHPKVMLGWALVIAALLFLGMVPGFLGLLFILPWLGHASWHVYDGLVVREGPAD